MCQNSASCVYKLSGDNKMNNNRIVCNSEQIELFLQQKLSGKEQTAFEMHLDECTECRRRLEAAAACDDIWTGVRDSLRGEQLPPNWLQSGESSLDSARGDDVPSSHEMVLGLLAPTDDDRMLGRLGTYEVVGVIGSGGMGVVLKAFDAALNRYVAIKVLAPHLGSSGAARKRFSREAQAAAAVVHENVIEIYGVAENGELPYLVMPYVRGPSLQRRLDREGPLALVEILRVGVQAARGLAAAHAQGLVHRDVKPANILLADGIERVKLTDFGLARAADDASLTRSGIIAGTPQYMSPEQARGESVDHRSDLFSLGSVLYAMCTGREPFRAETSYGVLRRITDEEPRPIREINPDMPDWLCGIVAKLMSKRPDDRFQSAGEVAGLLEECLAHVQQPTAVPLPVGVRRPVLRRRHTYLKGTIAMITTLGVALLSMSLMQATDPPDIAGQWSGEGWGQVVLTQTAPGQYTGTYTDTVGKEKEPGKIELKWSRIERRFNGAWSEGENRFGDLSIRLVDKEIRGALTTDPMSKINPATPRLADLLWTREEPLKLNGVKWIEGGAAGNATALQFDGSGKAFVDVPDPSGLPAGMSARTLAASFKLTDADDGRAQCIVGWGPNFPDRRFALCVAKDRIMAEFCRKGVHGRWKPDTQWHHLVAVVPEGCSRMNQVLVYLDGVQVSDPIYVCCKVNDRVSLEPDSTKTHGIEGFDTDSGPLAIGGIAAPIFGPSPSDSLAFKGTVSEVRLYDRPLSSAEIQVLYAHPDQATSQGLVAGYHLNEGRGKTIVDFSDKGNTGTLQSRDKSQEIHGTRRLEPTPDESVEE